MKFRAAGPTEAASADVTIVPLFDDKLAPKSLPRAKRSVVERLAAERGATVLYNVLTHIGGQKDGRIVVVGAGKKREYDADRARNVASAGIKSLWKTDARTVAIYLEAATIGAARAARPRSRACISRCSGRRPTGAGRRSVDCRPSPP